MKERDKSTTLTVTGCRVTTNSVTIAFSAPVATKAEVEKGEQLSWSTGEHSALNPSNYSIFDPGSVDFTEPRKIKDAITNLQAPVSASARLDSPCAITITFIPSAGTGEFQPGDWVNIVIQHVHGLPQLEKGVPPELEGDILAIARQVRLGTENTVLGKDFPVAKADVHYDPETQEVSLPREKFDDLVDYVRDLVEQLARVEDERDIAAYRYRRAVASEAVVQEMLGDVVDVATKSVSRWLGSHSIRELSMRSGIPYATCYRIVNKRLATSRIDVKTLGKLTGAIAGEEVEGP